MINYYWFCVCKHANDVMHNELDTIDKQSSFLHVRFSFCCSLSRLLSLGSSTFFLVFFEVFMVWVAMWWHIFILSNFAWCVRVVLAIWRSNGKFKWRQPHNVWRRMKTRDMHIVQRTKNTIKVSIHWVFMLFSGIVFAHSAAFVTYKTRIENFSPFDVIRVIYKWSHSSKFR